MEALKLSWLGQPLVELNGRSVKLETRKAAALLAYLSLHPEPCQREQLATMFWPEGNQQKALANLRRTLSSLNASLPGWLQADRETIRLKSNLKIWVDVDAFYQHLSQVKEHSHADQERCVDCLSWLEQAVQLYRGCFLDGLNLTDSPGFDEWQFFQRENLQQELATALQRLSVAYARKGEWSQAIVYARRWVSLDPLNEPACRLLMDLYAHSGQRTAALRQYEALARLLDEQMEQTPEEETQQLYEQLRWQAEAKPLRQASEHATTFPLLKTKLYIPTVPATRVVRSHLLARLDEIEHKVLTLISAPAGFGKTTLLTEWIGHTPLPVAWFSLDSGDNEPYRFLAYLITALESIREDVGSEARQIMQSLQLVPPHIILASLLNDLTKVDEPYVIAFDDYQFITEHAVHETMAYLLEHIPSNMHLVISTRADPPLPLGRLRARGQMLELRTHDLCFDAVETTTFLNDMMSLELSPKDIETLQARTEGWVVGLQMAALSLKDSKKAGAFIQAFSGSHRYILDYLLEEVLRQQPVPIQAFLMQTSILERLSGPLCDALMTEEWKKSGESGQAVLEYLDRNNLFLISLDEEQKWFRYHHLFADLLQSRLKQNDPGLETTCHQQAARWFAENSYRVEAVDHALAARDFFLVADLIEKLALPLIARNEILTVMRWINSLPKEVSQNRPRLILYHAWVLARLGNFDNLESLLQEAESMLSVDPQSPDLDELRSYLVQLRAYVANIKGDADLAIRVALGAKEPSEETYKTLRNISYLVGFQLGYAYYSKGDLEAAERIFQSVATSAENAEDIYNAVIAQIEIAGIQLLRGNLLHAEKIYDDTQEWLAQKVQDPVRLEGIIKVCHAGIFLERDELLEASRLVQEGIRAALLGSRTNTIAYGYVILANIRRAQGDLPQARESLEKAIRQIQERHTYPRTVKNVKICQVEQWLAEGNLTAAQQWALEEFQTPDEQVSFYRELEFVALVRVLLASKRFNDALHLLEKMAKAAELGRREGRLAKINILRALALNGLQQVGEALQVLEQVLAKAQSQGYFRSFLEEGAPLRNLLQYGKQQGMWQKPGLRGYIDKLLASFSVS